MSTLITGAGLVGSLAAAQLVSGHAGRSVFYDVAFSVENAFLGVILGRRVGLQITHLGGYSGYGERKAWRRT